MKKIYRPGDMTIIYELEGVPSWLIIPSKSEGITVNKNCTPEPLVQFKFAKDDYPSFFLHGHSMKYSKSVRELSFVNQEDRQTGGELLIKTELKDGRGNKFFHIAVSDGRTIRVHIEFENKTNEETQIEMISSFTLGGLTPFEAGDAPESLILHRLQSFWSAEGRLDSRPIEEYQLEPSWSMSGGRNLRFGQVGSMPVREYFPFIAIEDKKRQILWGAQLAIASSWQIEATRIDNGLSISGGLADREFGHWKKNVAPGELFKTPEAILSVCCGDIDELSARLISAQETDATADSENLPVIFNEFCTTWGNPSIDNIKKIAERLDGSGVKYLVIDCGWYLKEGKSDWGLCAGDWIFNKKLFPNGLKEAADIIRSHGMTPGLWFEMEVAGRDSDAFNMTDHLLKRDGVPVTAGDRRFWDMQDEWVWSYLSERVIGLLKKYNFGYLKVDYNDNIGIGCDGAESPGEALRQKIFASQDFFRKIRRDLPELVIENCSSGGHRLEPSMMQLCDMASFSDAHECVNIPVIAANVQRAIPAWKSQIWAVLRKSDNEKRLYYSIANTFLGRMCLSGDIFDLSDRQWQIVKDGITFYEKIKKIIRFGTSRRFGKEIKSYNHLKGWQAVIRRYKNHALVVFHAFENPPESVQLPIAGKIISFYGEKENTMKIDNQSLIINCSDEFFACAALIKTE